MENLIKAREISAKYRQLSREADKLITNLAKEGFSVREEETHNKDYFFSNIRGQEFLFDGLDMQGDMPVVKGIVWEGLNMHCVQNIQLKEIPTSDVFAIISYIDDINRTRATEDEVINPIQIIFIGF